ncbi:MAG: IS481 family transposase [Candidatus Nanopelagicales bacterium]|nr:IS481 family transposase [Candidatus Nanopelagicales bacterium]
MPHANAPLSELGRLKLARFHVESGSTIRGTAERFQVSTTTVIRWSKRYRAVLATGTIPTSWDMADISSRPHRSPTRTRRRIEKKVKHLRTKRRLGPVQIAGRVGIPASTVHRILVREGLNRLDHMDRATGEVIRYERPAPGDLVHVDVKKFGLIPPGGGWKTHGRSTEMKSRSKRQESRNAQSVQSRGTGRAGYAFVHSAVDDRSRLAYSEVHDDETAATTVGFWTRALAFYAGHGITVKEVISDNGPAYRSGDWVRLNTEAGIKVRRTRPYRPQTNGKVERYQRTLRDEWGYAKAYRSESARRKALTSWLHIYNHHRPHTALGGKPPATRVTNLTGQNN